MCIASRAHLSAGPESVRWAMVLLHRVLQQQGCLHHQLTSVEVRICQSFYESRDATGAAS